MNLWAFLAMALMGLPSMGAAALMSIVQESAKLPPCAISCLNESLTRSACAMGDPACICADKRLEYTMSVCVLSRCTVRQALEVKRLAATACDEPVRDRSGQYVAISNSFGIISAVFVIQRFAYKYWARLEFGLDDWFTLATIIIGVPDTVINAHGVAPNGMGKDAWTVTADQLTNFGLYFYVLEVMYFAEIALIKLSFLFFYARIFPARGVQRVLWGTVVFVSFFGAAFVLAAMFQCTPVEHYWLRWDGMHEGRCVSINALAWSNAIISIVLDAWMLAIPLWQLRKLKLDWKKKFGVALMFSVGAFVTIVSILRLKSLVMFGSETVNPTWEFFDAGVWSTVEINVGLICACLPAFRLLLVRMFPKRLGSGSAQKRSAHEQVHEPAMRRAASRGPGSTPAPQINDLRWHERLSRHIVFQKAFTVDFGTHGSDSDETRLVSMKSIDMAHMRPESVSNLSFC